jgi:hypothetical protein
MSEKVDELKSRELEQLDRTVEDGEEANLG